MNSGPTGGFLEVSPESGYQLETPFFIATGAWIDDKSDLPFRASILYFSFDLMNRVLRK